VAVARLATEQHGVLHLHELADCGLDRQAVAVRVANGRLHALHPAVYAVGHLALTLEGRFLAAVKACSDGGGDGAVLSHAAAGALWGFLPWEERLIDVTIEDTTPRRVEGLLVHRTIDLEWPDVRRHRGIAVTSPARTLIDLAAVLPFKALRRAVRQAQALELVNLGALTEALGRLGRRGGMAKLRRIVATGPAPTRSELEDAVLDLMLRGGLAHPDVNRPLWIEGQCVIPDFRWPEQRLVIEADGARWHDGALAREDDAERQALLEGHGERVLRVTWVQAIRRPAQTLQRFAAAGAPLSSASAPG
jgi:very-short-patch-repair endonuclease